MARDILDAVRVRSDPAAGRRLSRAQAYGPVDRHPEETVKVVLTYD